MNERLRIWNLLLDLLFERDVSRLAPRVAQASGDIDDFWPKLISCANVNLVTAALWRSLLGHGLSGRVPAEEAGYLQSFHAFNGARNRAVLDQLLECAAALNRRGIEPMPIKGAAHLASGLYADAGDRFFADIDVLVPAGAADEARSVMDELGYFPAPGSAFDHTGHHHLAPFVREGGQTAVEIHVAPVPAHAAAALPAATLWRNAARACTRGVRYAVPSATDAVMLAFLHAEIVDRSLSLFFVPLRPLQDVHLLQRRFGRDIDWQTNFDRAETIASVPRLETFLHVLHRVSHSPPPVALRASTSRDMRFGVSRAAIAWPSISRWILRADRLSRRTIRERYGVAGGFAAVNRCRMRELSHMASRMLGIEHAAE